jgi:hypothetical protein
MLLEKTVNALFERSTVDLRDLLPMDAIPFGGTRLLAS